MNVDRGFQLQELRGVFKRRASLVVSIAFGVFLLSVLVAFWLPNQYSSAAMLSLVPRRRKTPVLQRANGGCCMTTATSSPPKEHHLFQEITKSRLEAFRAALLRGKTQRGTRRTVKAVRNIIDWHLRSLWRDAEREGYAGPFPRLDLAAGESCET